MRFRPSRHRAQIEAEAKAIADFYNEGPGATLLDATDKACALCKGAVTDDDFCFGCQAHICKACDSPDPDECPQDVAHNPAAHRRHLP